MNDAGYLFDNTSSEARGRFAGLESLFDESTTRYLREVGVGPGWDCWELGAGGGSIATWLGARVGPSGSVLATDLNVDWIAPPEASNLTIARHDVVHDPIPTDTYDLVHARLVLVHIPEREHVLGALTRSLRPGGWLLIEDFDAVIQDGWEPTTDEDRHFRGVHSALQELLARRGADIRYARRLPELLRAAGLTDISVEGRLTLGRAAQAGIDAMRANLVQTTDELLTAGLVSPDDLKRAIALLNNAEFPVFPLLVSARGRRAKDTAN